MFSPSNVDNRTYTAKLLSKKLLVDDIWQFDFKLEKSMAYKPGQYVWLVLSDLVEPDAKGSRRAFSIADVYDDDCSISIILRSSQSGYKKSLLSIDTGHEVIIIGPFGSFFLPNDPTSPVVLISGGTGLSPFISFLKHEIQNNSQRAISLYAVFSPEKIFYSNELDSIAKANGSVTIKKMGSGIHKNDFEDITFTEQTTFYISGPQGFVDETHSILLEHGVFEHQFRFDQFYPTAYSNTKFCSLFKNGAPNIDPEEPDSIRRRAYFIYSLVDQASNHIVVTDTRGYIIYANAAAEKTTGYSLEEMLGQTPRLWGGLMPRDFYDKMWKSKINGEEISTEIINRRKNGELYVVKAHISPIKDETGKAIGYIGSEEDITYIRLSEEQAKEATERFEQLANKISEIFWITNILPYEKVLYVSPAFENIWGVSRESLYEDPRVWTDHIHKEDVEEVRHAFESFLSGKTLYDVKYRIIGKDGVITHIHDQGERIVDDKENVVRVVGVARDITTDVELDKMKDEFLSMASHELRTPMTAIDGLVSMLLDGEYGQVNDNLVQPLRDIANSSQRLIRLVNDLLSYSRLQAGKLKINLTEFDIKPVIEESLHLLSVIAKDKNIELSGININSVMVQADIDKVKELLTNLIGNSLKFTDNGSISISLNEENNYVKVYVKDTGIGIKEEDKDKIFSKFKQLNSGSGRPPGTGLGLYISKEIVNKMGGNLWLENSESGKGSIFAFSLPKINTQIAAEMKSKLENVTK